MPPKINSTKHSLFYTLAIIFCTLLGSLSLCSNVSACSQFVFLALEQTIESARTLLAWLQMHLNLFVVLGLLLISLPVIRSEYVVSQPDSDNHDGLCVDPLVGVVRNALTGSSYYSDTSKLSLDSQTALVPTHFEYARDFHNKTPANSEVVCTAIAGAVSSTVDSGATATSFPLELVLSLIQAEIAVVVDSNPNISLVVADDNPLVVKVVVDLPCCMAGYVFQESKTGRVILPNGAKVDRVPADAYPELHRVLGVQNLSKPLLSVRSMRARDSLFAFLNPFNPWGVVDHLMYGKNEPRPIFIPFEKHAKQLNVAVRFPSLQTLYSASSSEELDAAMDGFDLHCALGHGSTPRLKKSDFCGINVDSLPTVTCDCRGCRLGGSKRSNFSKIAPKRVITDPDSILPLDHF